MLQLARAFAAMIVVVEHSNAAINDFAPVGISAPPALRFGYAGVDIFFVVSGFIISLLIDGRAIGAFEFIAKRVLRIVPFYWIFSLILLGLLVVGGKAVPSAGSVALSLLVLPQQGFPLLGVGWSLEHEFIFYAEVAALLAIGKTRVLPIVLMIASVIGIALHGILPQLAARQVWDLHLFSLYNINFLCGVMIHRLRHRFVGIGFAPLLGIFAVATFGGSLLVDAAYAGAHIPSQPTGFAGLLRVVVWCVAGSALLGGLIALEPRRASLTRSLLVRAGIAVGDASYALYLVHPILFIVIGVAMARLHVPASLAWPVLLASCVAAPIVAVGWYRLVERPYLRAISSPRRRRAGPGGDGPA